MERKDNVVCCGLHEPRSNGGFFFLPNYFRGFSASFRGHAGRHCYTTQSVTTTIFPWSGWKYPVFLRFSKNYRKDEPYDTCFARKKKKNVCSGTRSNVYILYWSRIYNIIRRDSSLKYFRTRRTQALSAGVTSETTSLFVTTIISREKHSKQSCGFLPLFIVFVARLNFVLSTRNDNLKYRFWKVLCVFVILSCPPIKSQKKKKTY